MATRKAEQPAPRSSYEEVQARENAPSARTILDAAEELFCTRGFSGTSMRDVAAASGQHLASANYYFGSKLGLFEAAFLRRIVPVNRRRIELLEEKLATGRHDLPDIVDAYLTPLFEQDDDGRTARLIMLFSRQLLSNPDEHSYLQAYYDEVSRAFIEAIGAARPAMAPGEAIWGYNYMIGVLVFTLAGRAPTARVPDGFLAALPRDDGSVIVDRLRRFICAGIDALG